MSKILVGARCNGCGKSYMMSADERAPQQCPHCQTRFPSRDTGEVFYNCGNELAAKGDFAQAIEAYSTATHHNSRDKHAHNNRGLVTARWATTPPLFVTTMRRYLSTRNIPTLPSIALLRCAENGHRCRCTIVEEVS